jgi:methanogenic corrinoid protein MtbC1
VVLALALRDRGWRVTFLGADTPIETVMDTARRVAPEVIVLATLVPPSESARATIRALARDRRVVLAGAGVTEEIARSVEAEHFAQGPIEAATYLANGAGH